MGYPSTAPPRRPERRDVGLCFAGPVKRMPPDATIDATRRMATSLGADVFAVLAARGTQADFQLPAQLQDWLVDYVISPDGGGTSELRAEYSRANPENRSGDLLAAYSDIGGNFLGPLVGGDGRNAYMVRDLWHCLVMIRSYEERKGVIYHYFAWNRLDNHWLSTPPPLHMLRQAHPTAIWVPDGQDWDGLNDRFALVPRRWRNTYFGRWPLLLNGSMLPVLQRATRSRPLNLKFEGGPEWLLVAALREVRAPVRRFPPVAAILCQVGTRRGRYGRCTRPWLGSGLTFKYSSEASEAHMNTEILKRKGWGWRIGSAPALNPDCFESEEHMEGCCSQRAGLNGDVDCWTDVYTYARCCRSEEEDRSTGLWLLPSPQQARQYKSIGDPVCWPLVSEVSMCITISALARLAG